MRGWGKKFFKHKEVSPVVKEKIESKGKDSKIQVVKPVEKKCDESISNKVEV